jgi:GNAT superfamily N-acetyltransferase
MPRQGVFLMRIRSSWESIFAFRDSLPRSIHYPPCTARLVALCYLPWLKKILLDAPACVILRDNIAEMKRMYVLPLFQGQGTGKALTVPFIAAAKLLGYDAIRLDTLPKLERAMDLYGRMGFTEIEVYRHNHGVMPQSSSRRSKSPPRARDDFRHDALIHSSFI